MSNKILVSLLGSHAEVILGTTIIRALKEKNLDCLIDCIVNPQLTNLLDGNPDINKIIAKENYYEANIYYLENTYDEFLRVGFTNASNALWHRDPDTNQHLVEVLAKRAGLENVVDKKTYLYLNNTDIEDVNDYWEDLDKNAKYVAINTTANIYGDAYTAKDWDIKNFEIISQHLISKGYKIIQVGLSTDRKIKNPEVIDFTSKFTFKQNIEVIRRCVGYLGIDSPMAYLAGASGTLSLILMASTQFTGGAGGPSIGTRQDNVFYFNATKPNHPLCSPACFADRCLVGKAIGCSDSIPVEQVANALESIMQKNQQTA